MSAATLVPWGGHTRVLCPYVLGATFTLEITPPGGPALQVRARVTDSLGPFTMSPVMRVALEEITSPPGATLAQFGLPMDAILKVYDHRFADSARTDLAEMFEDGDKAHAEDTGTGGDDYLLREHHLALTIASYFTSECSAYERLVTMQGADIPIFYGTTRFLGGKAGPNLDLTKPGILLQYIEGTHLCLIKPEQADIGFIPDGSDVVIIDFADSQLRKTGMSDYEWKKEKWTCDEEGKFGELAELKWNWKFEHSYGWRVELESPS